MERTEKNETLIARKIRKIKIPFKKEKESNTTGKIKIFLTVTRFFSFPFKQTLTNAQLKSIGTTRLIDSSTAPVVSTFSIVSPTPPCPMVPWLLELCTLFPRVLSK